MTNYPSAEEKRLLQNKEGGGSVIDDIFEKIISEEYYSFIFYYTSQKLPSHVIDFLNSKNYKLTIEMTCPSHLYAYKISW